MYKSYAPTFRVICGVVIAAAATPAEAGTFTVLHAFQGGNDGRMPHASMIDVNGTLYGTTLFGGASGDGTVFALDPKTGTETVLHAFQGGPDGYFTYSDLAELNGTLYGTTYYGGAYSNGTVFALNLATGIESTVYAFQGSSDGGGPDASLTGMAGMLYGTTGSGGANGNGTVFSLNPTSGVATALYSFPGSGRAYDITDSLLHIGRTLYGTTASGGTNGYGMAYSLNPATSVQSVLYSFQGGSDAANPERGLINVRGTLYGASYSGGANGAGTVFTLNPLTGVETVLYAFQGGNDGQNPYAKLTLVGDTLYGTTYSGGSNYAGTIFSVNVLTGAHTVLYSFPGGYDVASPVGKLIKIQKSFYGVTLSGGDPNCYCGAVFSFTP
ncbi:MAG TPA: choice-of-anchor tandem repeat GloVer-containing protein [Acetobacteraceae bacterium]|nr:choice-of-anchor tandem repeat GloVer-containing protein [Acetobacteraceae bacterium]